MISWASIAKRNIPATTAAARAESKQKPSLASAGAGGAGAGVRAKQVLAPPIIFSEADRIAEINRTTYARSMKEIAHEDETNCRPEFCVIPRPIERGSCSSFITDEARLQMEWDDYYENREYSNEV